MPIINFSDETIRKWNEFKRRPRAFYSALLLTILFFGSLFANFYANSRPIIVKYNNSYYYPIFFRYTDSDFGGFLDTEADYSDPFTIKEITKKNNWAIYPLIRWDYKSINFDPSLQHPSPPSKNNFLGTDNRGRDVLARLIYGFRISIVFGIILAVIDAMVGITIGAIEGFFGGKVDIICQRLIEIWSSIPYLYALILIASIFERGLLLMIFILSLFGWIANQRLVRVEFLKSRNHEYVKAARALGVSNISIIVKHILPNALTMVITRFPFSIIGAMTALVSLDFLGLGVPAPTPSFGESLNQGLANIEAWWIGLSTVFALMAILMLVSFVGEAILDVFDPKRKAR